MGTLGVHRDTVQIRRKELIIKMLSTFKLYGTRIAVDIGSGAVHILDALGFDMLRYLRFPLFENCLSTLRYDLAKYESEDVAAEFELFKRLNADGVFCSDSAYVLQAETKPPRTADAVVDFGKKDLCFASRVLELVDGGAATLEVCMSREEPVDMSQIDIVDAELERLAKELARRKSGRSDGRCFELIQFCIPTVSDEKGYRRITSPSIIRLLENEPKCVEEAFGKKCVQCGLMLDAI